MLTRLIEFLQSGQKGHSLPEPDANLALGALLVRVAKSDHRYLFEEISKIDRILAAHCGLNPVAAAKMRADCERLEASAPPTESFVALILDAVSYEQRLSVVSALWQVAEADGIRTEEEVEIVHLVENQLGIANHDSEQARAAAQVIP